MSEVVLVTGGARSGKSAYAQRWAEALPGPRTFVATATAGDAEMGDRIRRHQLDRAGRGWATLEAPRDLAGALDSLHDSPVVLVDCLTLWVSNLCDSPDLPDEDAFNPLFDRLTAAACAHPGLVLFVSNEVGLGIVPDNALARRYRDLLGRCHQRVAAAADRLVLMVCGCPLAVKGALPACLDKDQP